MLGKKLLITIIITTIAMPSMLSANNSSNIESIMSSAEKSGIAVVYNRNGRTLPFLFNPLSAMMTSMTVPTALKLGLVYMTTVWLLSTFFPQVLTVLNLSNGLLLARSTRTTSFDFDYETVVTSLYMVSEKLSNYLHIPEAECRYRAVCETSTFIAKKIPLINEWAKKVSGAFFLNLANPYSRAWINGMMQIDCATTYSQCYESPYKTILNKVIAKRR